MDRNNRDLLLSASSEGIFITDAWQIIAANEAATDLFGYSAEEFQGLPVVKLFLPFFEKMIAERIANKIFETAEVSALSKNNTSFPAQVKIKSLKNNDRDLVAITVRDISDFKLSEKKLINKDALLESINLTAARFLESKNWRTEVDEILHNIGKAAKVSRIYIFQNFTDQVGNLFMKQEYEWVADHIEPQISNPILQQLYYHESGLNRLFDFLSKGEFVQGMVKDFPVAEREVLESQDIKSIFLTPIFQQNNWWGFIGYDECGYERIWNIDEIRLLTTAADIFTTVLDRELMEVRLTKTTENFRSLFDNSPDGIFVYDYNGNVLDVNDAACRVNGFSKAQFRNKHITALVPDENTEKVIDDFRKWTTGEFKFLESTSKHIDGRIIPVEIRGTRINYFDKPAVLLVVRDISRRRATEDLLRKRMEFIQFISQISSEFIKMDLGNIEEAINKALEFVCKFSEVERGYVFQSDINETLTLTNEYCHTDFKPYRKLIHSFGINDFFGFYPNLKNTDYVSLHIDEFPENKQADTMRQQFDNLGIKSGIAIPLKVGGHFLGYMGFDALINKKNWDQDTLNAFMLTAQIVANTIIRQKTEIEMIVAKNKAEESDRLKTAFLSQMTHEMRTPLNSILGFAEIIEKEDMNPDVQEMVKYIISGGERLLNTFNLVIDLAELEAKSLDVKIETLNLVSFVRKLVPGFKQRATDKNLDFEFVATKSTVMIHSDESLLEKIIFNLIDNAIKYTHRGMVSLLIDTEMEEGRNFAVVIFKDTGIGIARNKLADVFTRFRQESEGHNRQFEGTGLGLSVAKGLLDLLDGEISIKSEPDKGSEIKVRFPLVMHKNLQQSESAAQYLTKNYSEINDPKNYNQK